MVFLRSTTDCTWPRLLSKVARSIVAFISVFLPHKRSLRRDYSGLRAARQWVSAGKGQAHALRPHLLNEGDVAPAPHPPHRSEEHQSELQSLMRLSYAVFCLQKKKKPHII